MSDTTLLRCVCVLIVSQVGHVDCKPGNVVRVDDVYDTDIANDAFDSATQSFTTTTTTPSFVIDRATSVGLLIAALPGLVFAFAGYRVIKPTLFVAGYASAAYAFYMFSPHIFKTTKFCCGEHGTKTGLIVCTLAFGLGGALLALVILKVGVFALGAIFGVGVGLIGMSTPLRHEPFFEWNDSFAFYYGCCALAFACVAILMEKFFVIFATAWAGTAVFFLGLDYFVKSGLATIAASLIYDLDRAAKSGFKHGRIQTSLPRTDLNLHAYLMLGGWALLSICGMITQYYISKKPRKQAPPEYEEPRRPARQATTRGSRRPQYILLDDSDFTA
eukprot:m.339831 g.339831  ORF g.339831 m.339831 type:complete len:331 (+) comp18989_c0_seq1:241-1233(+)